MLEIRNGEDYAMYATSYELQTAIQRKLGGDTKEGIFVKLRNNFEIAAQGSKEDTKLTIKIIDNKTGRPTFTKSGTQFQTIGVRN